MLTEFKTGFVGLKLFINKFNESTYLKVNMDNLLFKKCSG